MFDAQKKILIVEDDDDQRHMLTVAFETAGYLVSAAAGSREALSLASEAGPDLILLDITLTGDVDGWEVLRQLRANERTAAIPVMVVSARSYATDDQARMERARSAGAQDYLMKPYRISELLQRVQHFLASDSTRAHEE